MKKHRLFLLLTVFTVMFSFIACDNKEDELEKSELRLPNLLIPSMAHLRLL